MVCWIAEMPLVDFQVKVGRAGLRRRSVSVLACQRKIKKNLIAYASALDPYFL